MQTGGATTSKILAIGASGSQGLSDLYELLGAIAEDAPVAALIVLHRQFDKVSALRTVLQKRSKLPVSVIDGPQHLSGGRCYIGHPARHLVMTGPGYLDVVEDPTRAYRNATVDLLFYSVVEHAREAATGIVLSGCLSDGSKGLPAIKAAGGMTMARQPCHSVLSDMARNAIQKAGPLDAVGTPGRLASYFG